MVHDNMAKYNGFEPVDNKPVALPVGFVKPTEADRLHGLMQRLFVDMREQSSRDSFEDSLDFDMEEDDELPINVSQSEMRYMQEERLLTDAVEADRVVRHRRDAKSFKDKYYGGRKDGKAGVFVGGAVDGESVSADVSEKRGAHDGKAGKPGVGS